MEVNMKANTHDVIQLFTLLQNAWNEDSWVVHTWKCTLAQTHLWGKPWDREILWPSI